MPELSCEGQRRFLSSVRLGSGSQLVQGLLLRRDCSAESRRTWCLWNLTAVSRTLPRNISRQCQIPLDLKTGLWAKSCGDGNERCLKFERHVLRP